MLSVGIIIILVAVTIRWVLCSRRRLFPSMNYSFCVNWKWRQAFDIHSLIWLSVLRQFLFGVYQHKASLPTSSRLTTLGGDFTNIVVWSQPTSGLSKYETRVSQEARIKHNAMIIHSWIYWVATAYFYRIDKGFIHRALGKSLVRHTMNLRSWKRWTFK
jgi:hypothetical protein